MPFLQDYECSYGHRFEYLADSRETAPKCIACTVCTDLDEEEAVRLGVKYNEAEREGELRVNDLLAYPIISTSAAPITINRHNGDYAAREKERLTKRSKEHNRLKTSREEADANTERVVGKDTANVLFSKGLHA